MPLKSIPVLMYHALIDKNYYPPISPVHVHVDEFKRQMDWLAKNNYSIVPLSQLQNILHEETSNKKEAVLTFDDGYLSLFEKATPILQQYNFPATLFLTTFSVGSNSYDVLPNYPKSFPPNDRPLTWGELKEMQDTCWDIEAHGRRHLVHNMLNREDLYFEMKGCREDIDKALQKKSIFYSFPYGRYNTKVLNMLAEMEFKAGCSVHPGLVTINSDWRRLPRVEINYDDNLSLFSRKVSTGYSSVRSEVKSKISYEIVYRNTFLKDSLKYIKDLLV